MNGSVLLVDDSADLLRIYSTILTHAGFDVVQATNGEQAAEKAREARPRIIVIDALLRDQDGWKLAHRFRSDARTATSVIIMLLERGDVAPPDLYRDIQQLAKPVEPQVLLAAIREGLANTAAERDQTA